MGLLDAAISGMDASQQWMGVIGNNIANASTTGYKESDVNFANMLSQTLSTGGAGSDASGGTGIGGTNPQQVGLGVQIAQTSQNFSEGSLTQTGVPSNMAIDGTGFFVVSPSTSGSPLYYTRAGDFTVDSDGNLVDPSGNYLMAFKSAAPGTPSTTAPTLEPVNVNTTPAPGQPSTYTINTSGTVTVQGGTTYQIAMAAFPNPDGLVSTGNNLYEAPAGGNQGTVSYGQASTGSLGTLQSGFLEQSNVDLSKELSSMIEAQTDYEGNSKFINTVSSMYQFMMQQV